VNERKLLLLLGGAAALIWLLARSRNGTSAVDSTSLLSAGLDSMSAALSGWKNVGSGPTWTPYIAQVEQQYALPTDLLARVAYQESRFREEIIRGTKSSPAGALGMFQLMPQFFQTVNVPTPYSDADVQAQAQEAAGQLAKLYQSTRDWSLTLAAYNAGLGNVQKYGGIPPFQETQDYVAQITADVPALTASV
jgi:soluble lytic murein transglycosylase-like protein